MIKISFKFLERHSATFGAAPNWNLFVAPKSLIAFGSMVSQDLDYDFLFIVHLDSDIEMIKS